jgi:hypothetical protein
LSVRNQHDRDSRAFFTFDVRRFTHAYRFKLLDCFAARTSRALNRVREVPHASRRKIALQSKPYAAWVSLTPPKSAGKSHHPLPNPRALTHGSRVVAARCF